MATSARANSARANSAHDTSARADSARDLAEQASFQAFINCYLREVDSGQWLQTHVFRENHPATFGNLAGEHLLQLRLPKQDAVLLLDVAYRSEVGRHQVTAVFCLYKNSWQQESFWSVILLLVKELFNTPIAGANARLKHRQLELTHRLTDSLQNMTRYLDQRWQESFVPPLAFCAAEQSLIFGHWLHPTPKSRQGILEWQHQTMAPELQGQFKLHYFAVHRDLVEQQSVTGVSAEAIVKDALAENGEIPATGADEVLLPIHPLQAQWLLAKPEVREWLSTGRVRDIGPLGLEYSATSSVRTVYSADARWMYKLSLPVKITNSLRQNKNHELRAGVLMAELFKELAFSTQFPQFRLILDPAYLTLKSPSGEESGFEVIIRENPFGANCATQQVVCLAALLQDPWHPDQQNSALKDLVTTQAECEGRKTGEVAADWFDAYWNCAIEPCIQLFDKHGIALEAHQQNSLLQLENGYPTAYLYRDNQGFYLADNLREELQARQPGLSDYTDLFYPPAMIMDRFGYYLIVNQLFAVIHRLGADGLVPEVRLINSVRAKLEALTVALSGNGRALVERLLSDAAIPAKANLLTRIEDIDELEAELEMATYCKFANPLAVEGQNLDYGKVAEYA